jgi:CofH subfamily radical SAM domain protein
MTAQNFDALGTIGWTDVARQASPDIRSALETVLATRDGGLLTRDQCLLLAQSEGNDLLALATAADELRRSIVGDVVTYVVNRNINFTNVCFVGCKFCAFSRGPREPDSYFLTLEDVRAVKSAVPDMHTHAFSPMEVAYGIELTGMSTRDYLMMLRDNGLDTLPGTAAEILDDDVRTLISRNKLSTARWREIITTAHQCGIRSTSTLMYGHIETTTHWVNQLLLLRDIQSQTGGFTEFVPLGFVHQNTVLFQEGMARPGPTLAEHLKIHALARVMLAGAIRNVQVSWVKLSRETAQLCLRAGANDYGGTLMDENISRLAGATSGEYLSPEQFHERICELGRTPAERNTTYTKLKFDHDHSAPQTLQACAVCREPSVRF